MSMTAKEAVLFYAGGPFGEALERAQTKLRRRCEQLDKSGGVDDDAPWRTQVIVAAALADVLAEYTDYMLPAAKRDYMNLRAF